MRNGLQSLHLLAIARIVCLLFCQSAAEAGVRTQCGESKWKNK